MEMRYRLSEVCDPENPDEPFERTSPVLQIFEAEPYALCIDLGREVDKPGDDPTGPRVWIERRPGGWAVLLHDGNVGVSVPGGAGEHRATAWIPDDTGECVIDIDV